jgi:hypothetical protein
MNAQITGAIAALCVAIPAAGQSPDWCSYLGGSGEDWPSYMNTVMVDATGQAYVIGRTHSPDFPTTNGAYDRVLGGSRDAFASRISADGTRLGWSTFLGGSLIDTSVATAFDGQGRIIVVGGTSSSDFPTTAGAYDTTHNGNADAFIAILDPQLFGDDQLVHSTLLGGSGIDAALAVCYDPTDGGAIVVIGQTDSTDFPATPGAYDTSFNGGDTDMFVARFDPTLSTLAASTFVGGGAAEYAYNLHVGETGVVTFSGQTHSSDMPVTPDAYDDTFGGGAGERDGYAGRFDRDLTVLTYGTFFGGSADEAANAMDVDTSGVIVLAGFTNSTDFPVTAGAYDTTHNGSWDGFVSRIDPSASGDAQLVASTFVGGSDTDGANEVVIDRVSGAVTIAGSTTSTDYPVSPDATQATYGGSGDAVVSRLDSSLGELIYSTYIGGTQTDWGYALAGSVASRLTVAGLTRSADLPVTAEAYDVSWNGNEDAFLMRLDLCPTDLDGSGDAGFGDILAIIGAWGPCGASCPEDLSDNGSVDVADILVIIGAWGPCS